MIGRRSRRKIAAVVLVGTIAGVYAAEAGLAVLTAAPRPAVWFRNISRYDGLIRRVQALEALRQQGIRAYPDLAPEAFLAPSGDESHSVLKVDGQETLPLAGIANATIAFCVEHGAYVHYQSDEHGFNNPPGLWGSPARLLVLGDSFVQGMCVPPERNLVARLRAREPATLNAGAAGDGPMLMLATLREYGPLVTPRRVVWAFFESNDMADLQQKRNTPLLRRYVDDPAFTQHLAARQPELDQALIAYSEPAMRTAYEEALRQRRAARPMNILLLRHLRVLCGMINMGHDEPVPPSDITLFRTVLSEARRTVEGWRGQMVLAYLPSWDGVVRRSRDARAQKAQVHAAAESLGIPFIDVSAAFEATGTPAALFGCWWCHYNEEGYRVAGDAIQAAFDR